MIELYKITLCEVWHDQTKHLHDDRKQVVGQIKNTIDFEGLLSTGINNLMILENNFKEGDIVKKWQITSSIHPEKLTFDGSGFRTTRLNEIDSLIYSLGAGFSKKNRTKR